MPSFRHVLLSVFCWLCICPASFAQTQNNPATENPPAQVASPPPSASDRKLAIPDAQILKAHSLLQQGNLDAALEAADDAVKLSPESPTANLVMGQVLFRRGDIAQANEFIQKTLKLAPDNASAWVALSRIADVASLRKKAVACAAKAYSLDPNNPEVVLAWANTRPSRAETIAAYQQFVQVETKRSGVQPQWAVRRIDHLKMLGDLETDVLLSPVAHYDIPIDYILHDPSHLQGWGVNVAIGNCKPVKLMIDTGSPGILIGHALAEKCGVKKLYDGTVRGIGDKPPVGVYAGLADHLQVGAIEFKNVVLEVEDRKPLADEQGLIGPHLLQKFLVNLNLNDYKMSVDPLPPIPGDDGKEGPKDRYIAPAMESYAKIFQSQNHLLIPTKVGDDPKPVLFLIDTGSSNNLIGQEYVAKLEKLNQERNYEIHGVQGSVHQVFSADDLTLQFAGFRQMNQKLISNSFSNLGGEVQMSGLLGLPVLRWFTLHIDYRDGLVGFEYHEPKGVDTHRLR